MEDEIVYITIDNWEDYSKDVGDFVERLDNEEFDVNCNIITYDQCLIFFITTKTSWLKEHNLMVLKDKFTKKGKTKYHPEYDLSKMETFKNYQLVDFL